MTGRTVEHATSSDVPALARVITDAFLYLPASAWMVPALPDRPTVLGAYFTHLLHLGLADGIVYTTSDRDAVAIWFPHQTGPTPTPQVDDVVGVVGEDRAKRFHTFETILHDHHPTDRAHHHLAILAVAPQHQRRGLGTILITAHHQHLDRERIPAYLEAAHADLPRYYGLFGYQPNGASLWLPGAIEAALWPMWRDPESDL